MVLSDEQRAFLAEPHFAVAATIGADGTPHQTVIWYGIDGDELVFSVPSGSAKHRHLQRDPRISVCVEDGFRYITLSGPAELDERPEAARAQYALVGARYRGAARPMPAPPARPDPGVAELLSRPRVTVRVRIAKVLSQGFAAAAPGDTTPR
ncbi:MAG TPA: PPOX class F420-dependent oxidoreductase [Chloroflexaceae bacterium]|nr:PPOX class F420-dependent oxidoreductase [Chloroflexaceae bacterium]